MTFKDRSISKGLGNLLGISEVTRQDHVPLAAVVAIEGNYLCRTNGSTHHSWAQA